ncbi:lysine N(6)-hydroxylase/L-ornithine N(5)-oxygenase family protein [Stappia indica]|uniref:lysine N(6)-hydroxylase/L-ornithine N(5)-oxygenase family protein n=1 Tax=Stappia indica TaxID=538381 RepID=UPI001CD7C79C|nr:SidA/IucD/PvdA family monooxygenase [Stappia indica]MCA1299042.1 SidA/IucD/PvdA family monooxygenase [Stappia indica]
MQIVGVGVGPANLSLASLVYPTGLRSQFFEKDREFSWHSGLQLPNASLQVSFLKDLVTLADPTNPFSFLGYLHEHGRTYQFLNARFDAVTRQEFTQYLHWAARKNENIQFGEEVVDIDFDDDFVVTTTAKTVRAENISIAVGKVPSVPAFVAGSLGETTFHSSDYLKHADKLANKRVAIVGSGQSGAEIFLDLMSREGADAPAHVSWVSRRAGFWPLDDSPFTNDLFMPCHQNYFSSLGEATRQQFLKDNVLASDGISMSTLNEIYQGLYMRRFVRPAKNTVELLPNRAVEHAAPDGPRWTLRTVHGEASTREMMNVDVVIWATGYRNAPLHFMDNIAERLQYCGDEVAVDDNFAALWNGPRNRAILIHNASRGQKGLADPNLSLLAWRSAKMVERITGFPASVEPIPSAVCWGPLASVSDEARRSA